MVAGFGSPRESGTSGWNAVWVVEADQSGHAAAPDRFHRDEAGRFHLCQGARQVRLRPSAYLRELG